MNSQSPMSLVEAGDFLAIQLTDDLVCVFEQLALERMDSFRKFHFDYLFSGTTVGVGAIPGNPLEFPGWTAVANGGILIIVRMSHFGRS